MHNNNNNKEKKNWRQAGIIIFRMNILYNILNNKSNNKKILKINNK